MKSPLRKTSALRTLGASVALTCACTLLAAAQTTGTVKGTVVDAATQRPLDGAQISVLGTELGTLTNAAGQYQFNVPLGQIVLRIRHVGYGSSNKTVTVTPDAPVTVDFAMPQVAIGLDAVVVTGTGVATERRKLGNTIATIDANQLKTAPVNNVSEMLAAREPGVSILPSGGLTGEGARIRIRGAASLSQPNEPIVYVDGVRVDRGGGFGDYVGTGGGGYPSRLDDINPESIEHIEVLKGPAAATLYGTEASAGVIQIFTKQGSRGAPQFDFMTEQGISHFPKNRYMPNWGFARSDTQATRLSQFYGTTIQAFVPFSRNIVTDNLFETGYANTFSGAVSGGTSAVTYYVNGRYSHDDGPFGNRHLGPANDLDRFAQGSASIVILPTTNVKVKVNAEYVDRYHMTPSNNNNIFGTISSAIFGKPELAQCDAGGVPTGTGWCTTDGNANSPLAPGNPLGQAAFATVRENMQEQIKQDAKHFTGSINIAYQPVTQVSLDATLGVDVVNQVSTDFGQFGYDVDHFIQFDPDGFKFLDDRTRREITAEAKATWTAKLGEAFQSTLTGGGQGFVAKVEDVGEGGEHFPGPGLEIVGAGSSPSIYERFLSTVNAGVFAQDQLAYRDWAFLTLGGRYDRNSAFGKTSQGVFYPKASISLQPTSLPSWSSAAWRAHVSTFRVRAAIGESGLQPGAFDKFTTFVPLTSELGPGLAPSNLGNPNLKPEKATEWEVGSELGIVNDRAGFEVTYWNRVTRDALYQRQYAPSGGFRAVQLSNIGRVDAHGWEIGVNVIPVSRPEFSLKLFGNTAFLHEVVTSLGGSPPLKVGGSYPRYRNFVKEGYSPYALFGAKLVAPCSQRPAGATYACLQPGQNPYDLNGDGQFDTDADLLAALGSPVSLSSILPIRVDEDGDGDFLDHYLGKSSPDWAGAFGLSATLFKNVELSSLFEYKAGNYTITNLTFAFRNSNAVIGRNSDRAAHVEAIMTNPASTAQQRVDAAKEWLTLRALTPYDGLNQSQNGKFVRWRELGVTYNVPSEWASKRLGLRYVAVKASVRNLMLWTPYTGIDPELNEYGRGAASSDLNGVDANFGEGIDAFGLALPRRFTFSVRFGF
ncbi:MAG TPA: SusC/RagA family TonB-linked outer membrane protein [Gemmatimonadales bacterium]|nr:SusC/RagA family TonB-linked outer membrane protein [Gemmatimonadales bacterium]